MVARALTRRPLRADIRKRRLQTLHFELDRRISREEERDDSRGRFFFLEFDREKIDDRVVRGEIDAAGLRRKHPLEMNAGAAAHRRIAFGTGPIETIQEHREAPRNLLARNQRRATRTVIRQPELTAEELAEKEQVLVALRLVSYKLNLAQRKTQGLPQLNTIRNQHKIG